MGLGIPGIGAGMIERSSRASARDEADSLAVDEMTWRC